MLEQFVMNPEMGVPQEGFTPTITQEIGYGTEVATDPETGKLGLVPVPTLTEAGETGRERIEYNPDCYAKAVRWDNATEWTYYVRMDNSGMMDDPWGIYSMPRQNAKVLKNTGRALWSFRRVTEHVFLNYLKYLSTRNKSLLRICEREVNSQ